MTVSGRSRKLQGAYRAASGGLRACAAAMHFRLPMRAPPCGGGSERRPRRVSGKSEDSEVLFVLAGAPRKTVSRRIRAVGGEFGPLVTKSNRWRRTAPSRGELRPAGGIAPSGGFRGAVPTLLARQLSGQ